MVMLAAVMAAALVSIRRQMVICPDNGQPAGVACDGGSAVKALFVGGHLRVCDCDRWPEKAGCDRACEKQLER